MCERSNRSTWSKRVSPVHTWRGYGYANAPQTPTNLGTVRMLIEMNNSIYSSEIVPPDGDWHTFGLTGDTSL